MANIYDVHNPKHFCFDLEAAYENYTAGYFDDVAVEIYPLKALCDDDFDRYDEKDYCSPSVAVDFTWAPQSMLINSEVDEVYECGFPFTGTPAGLEKELRALGLICIDEDR